MSLFAPPLQLVFDNRPVRRKPLPTPRDKFLAAAFVSFDGWRKLGALEVHGAISGLVADEGFVTREIDELPWVEFLAEFAVQVLGIGKADAEGDEGADVSKDGLPHSGGELGDVLMAEDQVEAVFAGLSQDRGKGFGREILKLIHEEVEIAPLMFWLSTAGHGSELELGDEQGADQVGFVVADLALGEVGDEDATLVHDEGDAYLVAHLANDVADDWGEKELTGFVQNRSDGLALEASVPTLEFVLPKVAQKGVIHVVHNPATEYRIGEQAIEAEKCGVLTMR